MEDAIGSPTAANGAPPPLEEAVSFPTITEQLGGLLELCGGMAETQDMCEDVLERLQRTQYRLDAVTETSALPETTFSLHRIGTRFHAFLSQHTKKAAFERLVSTRVIVGLLRGFHCEIDEVEAQLTPDEDGGDAGQPTWKEKWEAAEHAVEDRLVLLWRTKPGSVLSELPDTKTQTDALMVLNSEAVRHKSSYSAKSQQLLQSVTKRVARMSGAPVPAVPEWFIPNHEVQRGIRPFDRGSFGEIYRGTWRGLKVVIKCVTVTTAYERRTFLREAKIWHKAKHPNIVKFFGACHLSQPCFFVCEEAENGNLVDYLDRMNGADPSLVWRLLHEVALGLQFLHQDGIVHGDLKCNQVLVSGEGVGMLTDFGLSFISAESRPEACSGAIRWKAPECLSVEGLAPTFESDVYSFGMCIVEALTSNLPWGIYLPDDAVMDHLRHRRFLPRPEAVESDEQWEFILRLCDFEPDYRLKLADALDQLRRFAGDSSAENLVDSQPQLDGQSLHVPRTEFARPLSPIGSENLSEPSSPDLGTRNLYTPNYDNPTPTSTVQTAQELREVEPRRLMVLPRSLWVDGKERLNCSICDKRFSLFRHKQHCRTCGDVICSNCSLTRPVQTQSVRVCVPCALTLASTLASERPASSRRQPSEPTESGSDGDSLPSTSPGLTGLWNDPDVLALRIPREKVTVNNLLSRGTFKEVYLGIYHGERVAIKRLLPESRRDLREIDQFLSEAKMTATMEHPGIVRLIGIAWDPLNDLCVVMEYMDGGDLRALLNEYEATQHAVGFDQEKMAIAGRVCGALAYFHMLSQPVIHRDLKSSNILLNQALEAKLSDFSASRQISDNTMTAGVGSARWMAPEVVMGERYDEKADMFSFGVILSELDTHLLPYSQTEANYRSDAVMLQMVVMGKLSVEFSAAGPEYVAELGRECVSMDPRDRPTAVEAAYRLRLPLWRK